MYHNTYVLLVFECDSNTIFFDGRIVVPWYISPAAHTQWPVHMCSYAFCFVLVGSHDSWHHFVLGGIMAVPWYIGPKTHRLIHIHAHKPFSCLLLAVTPYFCSGGIMAGPWCTSISFWLIHIRDTMHSYMGQCGIPHPLSGDATSVNLPPPPQTRISNLCVGAYTCMCACTVQESVHTLSPLPSRTYTLIRQDTWHESFSFMFEHRFFLI